MSPKVTLWPNYFKKNNGPFPTSFSLLSSLEKLTANKFVVLIKNCSLMDSNLGPVVSRQLYHCPVLPLNIKSSRSVEKPKVPYLKLLKRCSQANRFDDNFDVKRMSLSYVMWHIINANLTRKISRKIHDKNVFLP